MKKPLIFSAVFIVLILAAIGFAITNKKPATTNDQQAPVSTSDQQQTNLSDNKEGEYVDYSESNLASAKGEKILFFHAPWCPQCRSIEKGILEDKVPNGFTIIKVDYDTNQDLRQKYGVTLQTTFVRINDNNELIDKYVAYDEPTFSSVENNLLNR